MYEGPERRAYDHRISRIEQELESIVKLMEDDRRDRKDFRSKFDILLFGDGDNKKGLVTRTIELETAHKITTKLSWIGVTVGLGLALTTIWNYMTGKHGG